MTGTDHPNHDQEIRNAIITADVTGAHQNHGGYLCTCGHELNSPAGFTRHVVEATLAEVAK